MQPGEKQLGEMQLGEMQHFNTTPLGACNGHDVCYHCSYSKAYCDDKFFYNMRSICLKHYAWYNLKRPVCVGWAASAKLAVIPFGWSAYISDHSFTRKYHKNANKAKNNFNLYCICENTDVKYFSSEKYICE
ncbi:hypothetical protein H8356DRAFT_1437298 [Neocallimastix lanati (nom. inval.)]|nr:hypothetical protein H8356DRAFT_1437298 [Neocallimastix sp. JGI-2020a]